MFLERIIINLFQGCLRLGLKSAPGSPRIHFFCDTFDQHVTVNGCSAEFSLTTLVLLKVLSSEFDSQVFSSSYYDVVAITKL